MLTRTESWWLEADDAGSDTDDYDNAESSCESSEKVTLYDLDPLDQQDIARVINKDIRERAKIFIDEISFESLSRLAKSNKNFQHKLSAVTFIYQSNISSTFFPRRRKNSLAAEVLEGRKTEAVKQIISTLNKKQ